MLNSVTSYFTDSIEELKRVSWPGRQKTIRLTVLVLAVSLSVAAYLGFLDFVLLKFISAVIKK